jgi:hypothetical protein
LRWLAAEAGSSAPSRRRALPRITAARPRRTQQRRNNPGSLHRFDTSLWLVLTLAWAWVSDRFIGVVGDGGVDSMLEMDQGADLHPGALAWREPWEQQPVVELAGDRDVVETAADPNRRSLGWKPVVSSR